VAAFNSRRFVENRAVPLSREFRAGLRALFLDARAALEPWQFESFLSWVSQQSDAQLGKLHALPLGYEELTGVINRDAIPLETEMRWIAARIKLDRVRILE
jgi:hypothetical protein